MPECKTSYLPPRVPYSPDLAPSSPLRHLQHAFRCSHRLRNGKSPFHLQSLTARRFFHRCHRYRRWGENPVRRSGGISWSRRHTRLYARLASTPITSGVGASRVNPAVSGYLPRNAGIARQQRGKRGHGVSRAVTGAGGTIQGTLDRPHWTVSQNPPHGVEPRPSHTGRTSSMARNYPWLLVLFRP